MIYVIHLQGGSSMKIGKNSETPQQRNITPTFNFTRMLAKQTHEKKYCTRGKKPQQRHQQEQATS